MLESGGNHLSANGEDGARRFHRLFEVAARLVWDLAHPGDRIAILRRDRLIARGGMVQFERDLTIALVGADCRIAGRQ